MSSERPARELILAATKKNRELKSVRVPEWDTEIFFTPLTLRERKQIRNYAMTKDFRGADGAGQLDFEKWDCITVRIKALDAAGNQIFGDADLNWLNEEAEAGALSRISQAVHGRTETAEGEAKNA